MIGSESPAVGQDQSGEIFLDDCSELRLEPGDHDVRTVKGVLLVVREGIAAVRVQGGREGYFDTLCVDQSERMPFHARVSLNPGGSTRLRVQPGQSIVFDVKSAA